MTHKLSRRISEIKQEETLTRDENTNYSISGNVRC